MQDTQVKELSQAQPLVATLQSSKFNSRFDDAEYERWSQNLRNKKAAKKS